MFAVYLAIGLPYIPLLETFQPHALLVYQFAATQWLIRFHIRSITHGDP